LPFSLALLAFDTCLSCNSSRPALNFMAHRLFRLKSVLRSSASAGGLAMLGGLIEFWRLRGNSARTLG
jgi:hypothetical protein